jgi:glycosyltransferase involved in cell wall biosynthesis
VAHVSTEFAAGVEPETLLRRYRIASELLVALHRTPGIEVAGFQRFDRTRSIDWQGVSVHFLGEPGASPEPGVLDPLHAFARPLSDFRPHVIHVQGFRDVTSARWLSRYAGGAPLLLQHRAERAASRRLRWARPGLGGVRGLAFTSANLADEFRDAGLIGPGQRTFEIPGGSCHFAPLDRDEARRRTGMTGDPAVLWVGRLSPVKAPDVAFAGFAAFARDCPNARLEVVGPPDSMGDRLRDLMASSGLADRVRFVGPVRHDDLPAWYSAADVFLTAAPRESCNFALIEALACGCVPVLSDIAAHRALTDGWSVGHPFVAGNASSCAAALAAATGTVKTSAAARADARRHFERRLAWPAVARRFHDAYRALVSADVEREGD